MLNKGNNVLNLYFLLFMIAPIVRSGRIIVWRSTNFSHSPSPPPFRFNNECCLGISVECCLIRLNKVNRTTIFLVENIYREFPTMQCGMNEYIRTNYLLSKATFLSHSNETKANEVLLCYELKMLIGYRETN